MQKESDEHEAEKEKFKIWLNYLTSVYTQPSYGKEDPKFAQGKRDFIDTIKPSPPPSNRPAIVYDWDDEVMKRLKARQEGE